MRTVGEEGREELVPTSKDRLCVAYGQEQALEFRCPLYPPFAVEPDSHLTSKPNFLIGKGGQ